MKKSKFYRAPLALPGIIYKNHFYAGTIWPYVNSKGEPHDTTLTEKGFTCTCMGFTHHGKCKHIIAVHAGLTKEDEVPIDCFL